VEISETTMAVLRFTGLGRQSTIEERQAELAKTLQIEPTASENAGDGAVTREPASQD
jgi:hypothetical protein